MCFAATPWLNFGEGHYFEQHGGITPAQHAKLAQIEKSTKDLVSLCLALSCRCQLAQQQQEALQRQMQQTIERHRDGSISSGVGGSFASYLFFCFLP